jgi:hypothetical protein
MYEKMFEAGNKAQLEQMEANSHKDKYDEAWNDIDLNWAMLKIGEHIPKMVTCLFFCKMGYHLVLRKLASDIANLAHMIILKCDNEMHNNRG